MSGKTFYVQNPEVEVHILVCNYELVLEDIQERALANERPLQTHKLYIGRTPTARTACGLEPQVP